VMSAELGYLRPRIGRTARIIESVKRLKRPTVGLDRERERDEAADNCNDSERGGRVAGSGRLTILPSAVKRADVEGHERRFAMSATSPAYLQLRPS
jgi:hypothetical protein